MRSKVVIIGGGLSGTLAAMQLARFPGGPEVLMIEKNPELLGRGVAYQYDFTHQPLNVVAGGMSLFPDKPMDFVNGLNPIILNITISLKRFRHRNSFQGKFLVITFSRTWKWFNMRQRADYKSGLMKPFPFWILVREKPLFLLPAMLYMPIMLYLLLAIFRLPISFNQDNPVQNDPRYDASPWSDKVYSHIAGDEDILLVGSGLTAVDIVLGLILRKFKGKITMLSRRGRFPLPHDLSHPPFQILEPEIRHPRKMLLWIRDLIRKNPGCAMAFCDWMACVLSRKRYGLKWSMDEKKYFLRRIRPYWEIARHRIPAKSSSLLNEMMNAGQLELKKGFIVDAIATDTGIKIVYHSEGKDIDQVFHKVINCTGPESNYRKVRFPIISDLIGRGKVKTDELGLGIKCTPEGRIINDQDKIEEGIWCIGPMRKAVLWETTALRELREQASELAALIMEKQ